MITPDGSPVLVYRRLPPGDAEAEVIAGAVPARAQVLELGAGAGRVTRALVARGLRVTAVDESAEMLAAIEGAETVQARIEGLALGRQFDAVVLGSHLINVDPPQRDAFLRACREHVRDDGAVLVEHYPADWAERAAPGEHVVGEVTVALREVRRHAPYVTAVAEYVVDGHVFRQPLTARVLSADELAVALVSAGLAWVEPLTPVWTAAGVAPVSPSSIARKLAQRSGGTSSAG